MPALPRILCVDDEPNVLAGLARTLRPHYDVVTAVGAAAGLEAVAAGPAFHVVVSDLRMPSMDGAAFLGRVRRLMPDATRVLLTGQADLPGAMAAVNEGQIFRFLLKPCAPDALCRALDAACAQHRLVTAERVLLEQTLNGSIKALTDLLALVRPAAFGRATRVRRHVTALAERLAVHERWPVEMAALLSQVGCLTLPPQLADRLYAHGTPPGAARGAATGATFPSATFTREEQAAIARLPEVAERLIADIPRLEPVREILRRQGDRWQDARPDARQDHAPPLGARMLRVALDLDELETHGVATPHALSALEARTGWYDPALLRALRELHAAAAPRQIVREMRLADVAVGMSFAADVVGANGVLLVARGQEVTPSLVERIRSYWDGFAATRRVHMLVASGDPSEPPGVGGGSDGHAPSTRTASVG